MTTVNLTCSICSEDYGADDEVISTNCGHIFHNSCFQDWHSRSSSCPDCRVERVETHRVYLHVETPPERRMPPEIQVKLENKISQLEHQLTQSEDDCFRFQELHCGKEEEIKALRSDIDCHHAQNSSLEEELLKSKLQLEDTEKNLFGLLEQIDKMEADLEKIEIENDFLKLQHRNGEQKLQELKIEYEATKLKLNLSEQSHLTLKDKLTLSEAEIIKLNRNMKGLTLGQDKGYENSCVQQKTKSELLLEEKVRVLEEKLRQLSGELDMEIGNSTTLTVENMRLRNILALSSSTEEKQSIAIKCVPISHKSEST